VARIIELDWKAKQIVRNWLIYTLIKKYSGFDKVGIR